MVIFYIFHMYVCTFCNKQYFKILFNLCSLQDTIKFALKEKRKTDTKDLLRSVKSLEGTKVLPKDYK